MEFRDHHLPPISMNDGVDNVELMSREAVERVVFASAPEQEALLRDLWAEHQHHFSLVDDRAGITLDAGAFGIVRFTHRTMLQFWLLSFASWKALKAFSAALLLTRMGTGRINFSAAEWAGAPGQAEAEEEYARAIGDVRRLAAIARVEDFTWPDGVPRPQPELHFGSVIEEAAFQICAIATGFAFLHEAHHVTLTSGSTASLNPADEELECDRFARETLLSCLDRYSAHTGYDLGAVLEKRALGAALNAYFVLVLTPMERWAGSTSHPAVACRFRQLCDALEAVPSDAQFWLFLTSMLVAHLNLEKRLPPVVEADHFKSLCYALFEHIIL